jgi:general secretion pathway protein G
MQTIRRTSIRIRPLRSGSFHAARGISLIEILVVLAIIALITMGIAIQAMKAWVDSQKKAAGKDIAALSHAVEMHQLKTGKYPKSLHELVASEVIAKLGEDPWGADYVFTCPGEHGDFDIASPGKDGELGTDDDVNSWDLTPNAAKSE